MLRELLAHFKISRMNTSKISKRKRNNLNFDTLSVGGKIKY